MKRRNNQQSVMNIFEFMAGKSTVWHLIYNRVMASTQLCTGCHPNIFVTVSDDMQRVLAPCWRWVFSSLRFARVLADGGETV